MLEVDRKLSACPQNDVNDPRRTSTTLRRQPDQTTKVSFLSSRHHRAGIEVGDRRGDALEIGVKNGNAARVGRIQRADDDH